MPDSRCPCPSTTPSMHGDTTSPFTSSAQLCSGNKDRDVRAGAHRAGLSLRWLISGEGRWQLKGGVVEHMCALGGRWCCAYTLGTGFLDAPQPHHFGQGGSHIAFGIHLSLPSDPGWGYRVHAAVPSLLYVCTRNSNPGPHACRTSALSHGCNKTP